MNNFSLNWKNFQDHLQDTVKGLKTDDEFSDVTLVCDNLRKIEAHKILLSACSPVFKNILQGSMKQTMVIFLRGIDYEDLESLIHFIYTGEVTINKERLNDFLQSAKDLEIKDLGVENIDSEELKEDYVERNKEPYNEIKKPSGVKCVKCDEYFVNGKKMQKHFRQVHEEKKFACNFCDYKGLHVGHLKSHIEIKHGGRKIGIATPSQPSLSIDTKIKDPSEELIKKTLHELPEYPLPLFYPCDECDKRFSDKTALNRHAQVDHEGLLYRCDHCDHTSKRMDHLKHHVLTQHEGKRYSCTSCDYSSTKPSKLNLHVKYTHRKDSENIKEKVEDLIEV